MPADSATHSNGNSQPAKTASNDDNRRTATVDNHRSIFLAQTGLRMLLTGSLMKSDHGGNRFDAATYKPAFEYKCDEVLRFVPAIALVGMKALGVESRSSWGRLLVSSGISTALMGISVKGTKELTGRERPDGSDNQSFPSGHTAAAFMTATLFAKEYGHLSPWYSVGAYGVAASTAVLRRINDRHWMSDIMVGAGIGILSVELGYLIADLFYQHKPSYRLAAATAFDRSHCPSSAGWYFSYNLPKAIEGTMGNHSIQSAYGYSSGMETAWFFMPNIGIGGRIGMTALTIEVDGIRQTRPLDYASFSAGPYLSYALADRVLVGANFKCGYGFYPRSEYLGTGNRPFVLGGRSGWEWQSGISLTYLTPYNMSVRLLADYAHWTAPVKQSTLKARPFTIGISVDWLIG